MSRILAVDLGARRIGVALSDPTGTVAAPLSTVIHRERQKDLAAIAELARSHEVGRIVVGWPLRMDGSAGPAAKQAEAFAAALRRLVSVPVDLWDERLSTAAAERALLDTDVRRERRRAVRDQVAAALILQAYLAARPWERDPRSGARAVSRRGREAAPRTGVLGDPDGPGS